MIYAYLIEDVRALSDLFKAGVAPKRSANGQFTLYRVRHPEYKARRALVLCGVPKSGLKEDELPESVGREIRVDAQGGELAMYTDDGKQPVEVFGFASSPHLEELIEPIPWREDQDPELPVLFWLRDEALMPEIVRRSLYLNNDRIQLARFAHDGESVTLLRVEAPSYYLLAWCMERPAGALELFYPMENANSLFVAWGMEHPLADLWRRAWSDHPDQWLLFPRGEDRRVIQKPEWRSIYDIATFTIDLSGEEAWAQIEGQQASFHVPLKLTPRHEPAPVEVIVLGESERFRIEQYLALAEEDELDRLELSAQTDDAGDRWYFLRERHRSGGVLLASFGGTGYARYKGFDNLFMPVSYILEPQLRRDQYKKLFELDASRLVFVVPNASGETARRVEVKKSSFEPLAHFVDHIVHFQLAELESILRESMFELSVYKRLPSRGDLGHGERRGERGERGPREGEGGEATPRGPRTTRRRPNRAAVEQPIEQAPALATVVEVVDATPTELEAAEARLERALVRQGPSLQGWQELGAVKQRLSKWHDAAVCAAEGLWTTTFPDDRSAPVPAAVDAFTQQLAQAIGKAPAQELQPMRVVGEIFQHTSGALDDAALTFVMQASDHLRSAEPHLGKKLRWLAWRAILLQTRDVRTQEDVREALLGELNAKGLDALDTPTFIRERILKDPELEFDDDPTETGQSSHVLHNVEAIEQAIDNLKTFKIREASRASLARIYAGMGLHARARDLLEQTMQSVEASLNMQQAGAAAAQPWYTRLTTFFRQQPNTGAQSKRPERWHAWVALNAWITYQRIDPGKAEEAQQAYQVLFGQLQRHEQEDLNKVRESLENRAGQSNIAEFLAADTRSFFSSKELPDEMSRVVRKLRDQRQKNDEKGVQEQVIEGIRLAREELGSSHTPSLETVARLILEMVEVLRKLKWEQEQRPVDQFEEFVLALPKEPASKESSRLYFAVLHCAAARAMMDLGREKEALKMLVDILKWVGQDYMQVLDFVDLIKKEVLLGIELAPRNQRTEVLRWLMNTLIEQERLEIGEDSNAHGHGFEIPFQAHELIQMIDSTLEAAVSNEKLVLRRLRDYEEREEGRLRFWVQRDQPASA